MEKQDLHHRLQSIRLLAMDVDGVLTDGSIIWSAAPDGGPLFESKSFSVRDGLGISLARAAGLTVAWITGRTSRVVERRAVELDVTDLHQKKKKKAAVLEEIRYGHGLPTSALLYIGDDLNDLPAFRAAGVRVAVADAAPELQAQADWVTRAPGGRGAVREVVEAVLRSQRRWEELIEQFLHEFEQAAGQ